MFMIMHHIALCISCIASLPLAHARSFMLGQVEPESKIQAEQVQRLFGGAQASSGKDTNLALDQGKPRCI
jgi:hypothetical protein